MGLLDNLISAVKQISGGSPKPIVITDEDSPSIQPEHHVVESQQKPVETKEKQYRNFRLTYYLIAEQDHSPSTPENVPILDGNGTVLALVEASFFSNMSLQGSGKLRDGRLLNVTSKFVKVRSSDYTPVLAYHKKFLAKRSFGYSGIAVDESGNVSSALSFYTVPKEKYGKGYGIIRGVPHEPFRTLAVDMGLVKKSDPIFKNSGGVIPALTKVHIKEFVGKALPDGTTHDGWFTAIDNGGGIFGAHCDVFVGTKSLKRGVSIPPIGSVWYEGIEDKIPVGYSYGLHDE